MRVTTSRNRSVWTAARAWARSIAMVGVACVGLGAAAPGAVFAQGYGASGGYGAQAEAERAGSPGPAGNAHPTTQAVSSTGDAQNPFGDGDITRSTFDMASKQAFARAVRDAGAIEGLRDLAVFHNGRVKILDTLARESLRQITGRYGYRDVWPTEDGGVAAFGYDPLFTMLDMAIDPGYYADKGLVHVEYLPLREAFLEGAYSDEAEREWWKRQGRLKPRVIATQIERVNAQSIEAPFVSGINRVIDAMTLYRLGWQNLLMAAPDAKHEEWEHLSTFGTGDTGGPGGEVGRATRDLAKAWRAGDAAGVRSAVDVLARVLPTINSVKYPEARRALELAYNRSNAFEIGAWMYLIAFLSLALSFGTGRRWLALLGAGALVAAVGYHGFGFVARCVIAERFAIQNQFESMTGLSLFATIVGLGIMAFRRQYLFGAAAAATGFLILITATQTGIPGVNIEREAAILNTSVLLKYHVTTVLVSYGFISLGMIISVFYLLTYYSRKWRGASAAATEGGSGGGDGPSDVVEASAAALSLGETEPRGPARVLADLDAAQMIVLQLAFWTLGVGILLGAWWADHSWGRWWAFDPKEVWALITWIVYLVVIHVRMALGRDRALVTAWLSIAGFIVMLWCYFGVNLLLPGLHAYA